MTITRTFTFRQCKPKTLKHDGAFDSFDEEHHALEEKANHFVEKIEELTKEEAASEKRLSQLSRKLAKVNEKHATLSSEGMEKERHLQQFASDSSA